MSGENIFIERMPESITRGVLLMHGAGGARLDANLPKYRVGKLQIVVREMEYQAGYDLARQVTAVLESIMSVDIDAGFYVHNIVPLHDPIPFPLSSGGFSEFSVNFKTAYVEQ